MYDYINDLEEDLNIRGGLSLNDMSVEVKDVLQEKLAEVKEELFKERVVLNSMKIAKVLTGDWFTGLEVDDKGNQTYKKGDKTLTVKADRVKVYI